MDAKTLASAIVTLLTSHFSNNQNPTDNSSTVNDIATQILPLLQNTLPDNQTLQALKSDPENRTNQSALSDQITEYLRQNPDMIQKLQGMLSDGTLSKISSLFGQDTINKIKGIFDKFTR